ncbi:hypothetical protein Ancab_033692 [Ancistrocladus abbreviatus]
MPVVVGERKWELASSAACETSGVNRGDLKENGQVWQVFRLHSFLGIQDAYGLEDKLNKICSFRAGYSDTCRSIVLYAIPSRSSHLIDDFALKLNLIVSNKIKTPLKQFDNSKIQ